MVPRRLGKTLSASCLVRAPRADSPREECQSCKQIFVKTLRGKTITVEVSLDWNVDDLKRVIEEKEGMPASYQVLVYGNKQLQGTSSLRDFGIDKESTVMVTARLAGGNVENTLSRVDNCMWSARISNPRDYIADIRQNATGAEFKDFISCSPKGWCFFFHDLAIVSEYYMNMIL